MALLIRDVSLQRGLLVGIHCRKGPPAQDFSLFRRGGLLMKGLVFTSRFTIVTMGFLCTKGFSPCRRFLLMKGIVFTIKFSMQRGFIQGTIRVQEGTYSLQMGCVFIVVLPR
eukprot:2850730-Amphidinium_carterae.1